jgi:hypothetical protein
VPKFIETMQKGAQEETRDLHKQMMDALKPNVAENELDTTANWLESQRKQNTPLYQQNKQAVDAQIGTLRKSSQDIQNKKLAQAKAGAQLKADITRTNKEVASMEGATDALNYATAYESETPTGPGDEALMEKFFELAKPSTGFRMSQPQIDMLRNARSWLDSAEAKARHVKDGTWFSADQRKQIIGTMRDLAAAKQKTRGEASIKGSSAKSEDQQQKPIYASAPGKPRLESTDGGKTWHPAP